MFRLVEGGEKLPQRATRHSAGFDMFAREDVVIGAGETKSIGLGVALDHDQIFNMISKQYFLIGANPQEDSENKDRIEYAYERFMERHYFKLCLRSSLGAKGLILPNGHGVIDMDYRNEIKMIIHNPIGLDAVDSAIRVFQVGMACSNQRLSQEQVNKEMSDFMMSRKHLLGTVQIKKGDKIGQLILCRHEGYLLPAEFTLDAERTGGFGSTDK